MSEVRIRENESLESALRRFKRMTARSGILAEARKREHYESKKVLLSKWQKDFFLNIFRVVIIPGP